MEGITMLVQKDLELIGQIVKTEISAFSSELKSLEESLGNRITKLEESQIRLEQSIRDTENLLIDELAKTQARIESNFKREIDELKKDNEIITSYYRSVRSDQSAIDMMQKNIFDIYGRLEVLEKNSA
jgi:chaperonin cofactor prefoldin